MRILMTDVPALAHVQGDATHADWPASLVPALVGIVYLMLGPVLGEAAEFIVGFGPVLTGVIALWPGLVRRPWWFVMGAVPTMLVIGATIQSDARTLVMSIGVTIVCAGLLAVLVKVVGTIWATRIVLLLGVGLPCLVYLSLDFGDGQFGAAAVELANRVLEGWQSR